MSEIDDAYRRVMNSGPNGESPRVSDREAVIEFRPGCCDFYPECEHMLQRIEEVEASDREAANREEAERGGGMIDHQGSEVSAAAGREHPGTQGAHVGDHRVHPVQKAEVGTGVPPSPPSRCDNYRDLLEDWAAWWNNVGRHHFTHYIRPPITETGKALVCLACQGLTELDVEGGSDRCQVCGRRVP